MHFTPDGGAVVVQDPWLQVLSSSALPSQGAPPTAPCCWTITLARVSVPAPQVALQARHSLHSPHLQSLMHPWTVKGCKCWIDQLNLVDGDAYKLIQPCVELILPHN